MILKPSGTPSTHISHEYSSIAESWAMPALRQLGQPTMTYTIHASKNDQTSVTVRINPATAVDKARVLELLGWQVHVTDSSGHLFTPLDFDRLSSFACEIA
jgi:hypothetical protein